MSDEPTERDVEALADVLADHRPSVGYNDAHADLIACSCDGTIYEAPDYRAHVATVLAERIAQARREGAAEVTAVRKAAVYDRCADRYIISGHDFRAALRGDV